MTWKPNKLNKVNKVLNKINLDDFPIKINSYFIYIIVHPKFNGFIKLGKSKKTI